MECKRINEAITSRQPAVARSRLNSRVKEAIENGKAVVLQEYRGKVLVRYEYKDRDGAIVVLAERLSCLTGNTDHIDFSWHTVLTVYETTDECLNL